MKIPLNNETKIRVYWEHNPEHNPSEDVQGLFYEDDQGKTHGPVQGSRCYIVSDEDDPQLLATGEAYLSEKDEFSRPVGRKISLARAIQSFLPFPEDDEEEALHVAHLRRQIWFGFFSNSNQYSIASNLVEELVEYGVAV